MKVRASVKADPGKGDKIVRRRGRLYVINKRNPNRKQRQKGPARKNRKTMARKAMIEKEKKRERLVKMKWEQRQELKNRSRSRSERRRANGCSR